MFELYQVMAVMPIFVRGKFGEVTTFWTEFSQHKSPLPKWRVSALSWKKIRCYASVVHGINLLLNRFPGKQAREKSALLREYKKAIERASLSVPRSLLSWLQEVQEESQ